MVYVLCLRGMVFAFQTDMAIPPAPPSLMDDKGFVTELDSLESDVRGFVARTPTARSWSVTTAERPEELADIYHFDAPATSPSDPERASVAAVPLERQVSGRGRTEPRFPALLFTLFVCLGAAGAAAAFHERVGHIVAHWQAVR
jgi:hypothetical protein